MKRILLLLCVALTVFASHAQTTTTFTRSIEMAAADGDSTAFATKNLIWMGSNGYYRLSMNGVKYSLSPSVLSGGGGGGNFWPDQGDLELQDLVTIDGGPGINAVSLIDMAFVSLRTVGSGPRIDIDSSAPEDGVKIYSDTDVRVETDEELIIDIVGDVGGTGDVLTSDGSGHAVWSPGAGGASAWLVEGTTNISDDVQILPLADASWSLQLGQSGKLFNNISLAANQGIQLRGKLQIINRVITPGGTTGNQTIDETSGTVNFAIAATTLTVTNDTVDEDSIIIWTVRTNDATCTVKNIVPTTGSFTINMTAGCTAETSVGFVVLN